MNFKRLASQAKRMVDRRGGTAGLKRDAAEVQEALKGGGSAKDKASRVADALKDDGPSAPRRDTPPA